MATQLPLFQQQTAQTFNATVVWLPETLTEQLQIDVGQSVQFCTPMADMKGVEVGDVVAVTWIGQTFRFAGVVAKAPKTDATATDSSTDGDNS